MNPRFTPCRRLHCRWQGDARFFAGWTGLLWLGLWVALASAAAPRPALADNFSISGGASQAAWSGYWWPMLAGRGFHLYDQAGSFTPLLKYGQATGNFGALNWEQRYKMTTNPANDWWGHCNGWAASTVLEREPTRAVRAGTIIFSTGDTKGLLAAAHQGDPVDTFAGRAHKDGADINTDLRALDFHRAVLFYLRDRSESLIFNLSDKPQVWNYPAYSFRMNGVSSRGSSMTQVTTTLVFADDNVLPNFVGTSSFARTFTYWVQGDPQSINGATAAGWSGNSVFAHPQFLWHPAFQRANDPSLNEPPNPLDYNWVKQLLQVAAQ
jgi:Transglutaminase elicitor